MKFSRIAILLVIAVCSAFIIINAVPSSNNELDIEYLNTPSAANLPFSKAVRVGNMLYLSGELGFDYTTGKLVTGGIKEETLKLMENLKITLEQFGSSLDRVVKCSIMIKDMNEWKNFNEVYVTYFDKDKLPARCAWGASALALDARVEIDCIAVINP